MTSEQWRTVVGFPDYRVSDQGRIVSFKFPTKPRELKQAFNGRGYPIVSLCDGKDRHTRNVARIVMLTFVGPRPEGQEIRHMNGERSDSRLANLAYGTHSENVLDSVGHGTHPMARRTHCLFGHAYDRDNTKLTRTGKRQCRKCVVRRGREQKVRLKIERQSRIEATRTQRRIASEIATSAEIREWAKRNGHRIAGMGYIPAAVISVFLNAQRSAGDRA